MDLYLVSRRRAWLSEEELAATADCTPAVLGIFDGSVRWVRSYVFEEQEGAVSADWVYESTSVESMLS